MKTILIKTLASLTLLLLCSVSFIACKKTGETIDAPTIESKLAGEESTMWIIPGNMFENESIGCIGIARILFNNDYTYSYTKGDCISEGTWSANYSANRTGQTITIQCVDDTDNTTRQFNLLYSKDNDTFYYLDAVNGLVALKKDRRLTWVETGLTDPIANRKGMVSIEHNDVIYFGLGTSSDGTIFYNDWYTFNGTNITKLADIPIALPYSLTGARAIVKGNVIYIVGGKDIETVNANTYSYDTETNVWENLGKELGGTQIQGRTNAVYFTLDNGLSGLEVLGLGSSGSSFSNFYTRSVLNEQWVEKTISGFSYGTGTHDYQNALSFSWNGGQFIGGGINAQFSMTNFMCFATYNSGLSIDPITNMPTPCNSSFAEGTGIELDKIAVVFGLKTASGYSDTVYVLNEKINSNYSWSKYVPALTASNNKPTVGESTVFWRVKNSAGNYDTYAGLGAADNKLYKLEIK